MSLIAHFLSDKRKGIGIDLSTYQSKRSLQLNDGLSSEAVSLELYFIPSRRQEEFYANDE
jgi:hypothetical protein